MIGQIEVDESCFGARRVKGKCSLGVNGKTIVFGLLKQGDKASAEIIPNCKAATLQMYHQGNTSIDSVIYSDGWRRRNGLVDYSYKKYFRVHHGKNEFTKGNPHINGIESFWGYAKK